MMCTIIIYDFVLAAFTLPCGTMQLPRVLLEQEAHWCAPCLCHPCLKYQTDMHSHSTRIIFESVGSVRKYLTCSTILQVKSRSGHRAIGQFWGESLRTPFFLLVEPCVERSTLVLPELLRPWSVWGSRRSR